jgi:hypothetical protein
MNSEEISDLKVVSTITTPRSQPHGHFDGMVRGEYRTKTVLSTDTFVRQNARMVCGKKSQATVPQPSRKGGPNSICAAKGPLLAKRNVKSGALSECSPTSAEETQRN